MYTYYTRYIIKVIKHTSDSSSPIKLPYDELRRLSRLVLDADENLLDLVVEFCRRNNGGFILITLGYTTSYVYIPDDGTSSLKDSHVS